MELKYNLTVNNSDIDVILSKVDELSIRNMEELIKEPLSEYTIKLAKNVIAENRKILTEIDRKKKNLQKVVGNTIDENTKDFTNLLNKLDKSIKDFQNKEKQDKKELIMSTFNLTSQEVEPKWLNKTTSIEAIKKELEKREVDKQIEEQTKKEELEGTIDKYTIKFNSVSGLKYEDLAKYIVFAKENGIEANVIKELV